MQNQRLRQIVYFDLNLDTNPPGRLPPMADLAGYLIERIEAQLCTRLVESERYLISILRGRLERKENGDPVLALLFAFADPDAADPANMHLQTRVVRRFDKLEGEGRAVSAHAVIDLAPRHPQGRIFRVLLENADHLGKTRVRTELQAQFRQVFQDKEITVENADGDEVRARPKIDLDAIVSDRLRQGIADATLKEVTLIDTRVVDQGFDAPDPVKIRRREMSLKVDVPVGQRVQNVLDQIKPWAREQGFEEMYVRWIPAPAEPREGAAMAASEPQRAKINLAQDDIGETLYAKKEFIELELPLGDLCTDFSDELVRGMIRLLG